MLRRIVGVTGVSLWAGLIVVAVVGGLEGKANGEQMFENLPEGWKVEKSFAASKEQTLAVSRKLGGRISKLTNTVLSIEGKRLQVNVLYCPTEKEAERIYKAVLEAHNGLAVSVAQDGNSVVEFAKSSDVELMNRARRVLGLPDARLDRVAGKLLKKIPDKWRIEKSFIVPREQTIAIGKKLGGRIRNLSNTIFSVDGRRFQVNVIECVTPTEAENIHRSILKMKGDPAFCLLLDNSVVEFVGDDVELAKEAVYELGIKPRPGEAKQKQISKGGTLETMAKDFIQLLADSDFPKAAENFDAAMKKAAPPEKLRQIWNSLVTQHGRFEKQLGTRMKTILLYKAVFVSCQFEKMIVELQVTFNTTNQIAGFHIAQIRPKANRQKQVSKDSRLGQKALASRE